MSSKIIILSLILILCASCRKINNYFQKPDTTVISTTIKTAYAIGYAANVAMNKMSGSSQSGVTSFSRSSTGFPCTSLMTIDVKNQPFIANNIGTITVAGLWSSEMSGILTVLLSNYNIGSSTFSLIGIKTFPVIKRDGKITAVFAGMDIQFENNDNPLVTLDLSTLEIDSEMARLDTERPNDLYIAVNEKAYFVDIENNGTTDVSNDSYFITGGGQLIEVTNTSAEITQQAMLEIKVSPSCVTNPTSGRALIQVTGTKDEKLPDLGSAILRFHSSCDHLVEVELATGMYVSSNGKRMDFNLSK